MPSAGLPCAIVFTDTLPTLFRCATPADIPGATGTPNSLAWFNGSGLLDSLILGPEFAPVSGGTLSIATGGITTSKLADGAVTNAKAANMPARSFKVNATNGAAAPSDLACTGAGQVPQDTGTALVCQQLNYSALAGSPPAVTSGAGDVNFTGPGAATTTIQPNVVTNSKQAQMAAMTIKGNWSNATANPTDIACSTAGTFLGNLTGTSVACSAITPAATSGLVATWPIGTVRTFLYDPVNGSDSNPGYSDGAGPYNPATLAKKTAMGVMQVLPRSMAGHAFRLLIASGTYASPDLDQFLGGVTGIAQNSLVRGTATNTSAGATAFADDANDRIFAGATTATNANSGGYNPTAGATTTSIPVQLAGGGAASFPAEPAEPLMWRMRFDSATSTAALRNVARAVIQISGTTLTPDSALPTPPSTSDKLYLEMPGVSFPSIQIGGATIASSAPAASPPPQSVRGLQVVGVYSAGVMNIGQGTGMYTFAFSGSASTTYIRAQYIRTGSSYVEPTTNGTVTVGGGLRGGGSFFNVEVPGTATLDNLCSVGVFQPVLKGLADVDGVFGGGIRPISGTTMGAQFGDLNPVRVLGPNDFAGVEVNSTFGTSINGPGPNVTITGSGAMPAIGLLGYALTVHLDANAKGSTGNNDVGLSLSTQGSTVFLGGIPTVTGTLGDVRLCDGTIVSWATAFGGIVDPCGNWVGNQAAYPLTTKRTGLSVMGNSSTAAYHFGDIAATPGSGDVLRESGSAVGFGKITEGAVTNLVTDLAGKQPTGNYITALTGDGTATGPGSVPFTLHNIPNLTTMAASVISTEVTGTTTPAAGTVNIHAESTTDTLWVTDSAGRVTTTARPGSAGAHNFLTGMGSNGTFTFAQPSYSDLSGSVPAITALHGDGSATGPGNAAFALSNIPSATTQAGFVNATGIATPATPATGHGNVYYDSTSQNLGVITEAGTYKHGVQTDTGATNQFVTGVTDTGFVLKARPTTANIQGPSGTGDQCLHFDNSGNVSGTGAPCGSGSGSVISVTASSPLASSGGTSPNITLSTSGVTPGTYVTPTLTVDATGRVTAASFTNTYQLVESDGTPTAAESTLNFQAPLHAADSGGSPFRTNVSFLYDGGSLTLNGSNQLQRAALTGDATASAGSNAITIPTKGKVFATSSDSAPDYLINKVTSSSGSVVVTNIGGAQVNLNVNPSAISPSTPMEATLNYAVKIPGLGAGTPGGWWVTSTDLPEDGATAFSLRYEYPLRVAATSATITVIVVANSQISDSQLVAITRNGSGIGTGVTIPAGMAAGTVLTQTVAISGGVTTDTYGVANTGSGSDTSGELRLVATVTVTQ